jgi:hypothetical protein
MDPHTYMDSDDDAVDDETKNTWKRRNWRNESISGFFLFVKK